MELCDLVERIGKDYTYKGRVVSKFKKLSGIELFVVEDDRGMLQIYPEDKLRISVCPVHANGNVVLLKQNEPTTLRKDIWHEVFGDGGLILQYFKSDIVINSKGIIEPTEKFKQYVEDVVAVPYFALKSWPPGFYRNNTTKEVQLLIQGEKHSFCIDGLHSQYPILYVKNMDVTFFIDHKKTAYDFQLINAVGDIVGELERAIIEVLNRYFS